MRKMRLSIAKSALLFALIACSHELDGPEPSLTALDPNLVCNVVTTTLTVTGAGLSPLAIDALTGDPKLALPTITLRRVAEPDGTPVSGSPITIPDDPANPGASKVRWASPTSMSFDVDPSLGLLAGLYEITIANANGKSFTATGIKLEVVEPPVLTSVVPSVLCAGGGDLVIDGTGFSSHATATVGRQAVTLSSITPTQLRGTLGPGLDPGVYDLVVDNGGGCTDVLENAITITAGPAVYFVDPPVVWNGIAIQATMFVSGIDVDPSSVGIRPSGTTDAPMVLDHTWTSDRPNRILATIPAGLAPEEWDVVVSTTTCNAYLPRGFRVTDALTLAVDAVAPPFGWTGEKTAVSLTAKDPAPPNTVQFQATPRAYLNPSSAAAGTVATPLSAVAFDDATRLTAIVPQNLPAGLYDVVVVNPDGSVGVLQRAFTITALAAPPPVVDTITPGSVVNQPGQAVELDGSNFRAPTVTATCEDDAGAMFVIDGVVGGATPTTIDATFDMGVLTNGAVCVLRVLDDDGTYFDFSALAVTNPAQNLPPTVADQSMVVARRGLGVAAGRATAQARFLYAIGGDDGTDAGLLASVEAASVNPFGRLSAFFSLPLALPEGRSQSTAVAVGRFVYLVGGRTASGATDSVVRAEILDPRDAPEINDLAFDLIAQGLLPGLYYYRVSAVMGPGHPSNPGGESLASDPLAVIVPPAGNKQVKLTLFWAPVPGAVAYRIYRTPAAGQLVGDVRFLDQTAGTSFVDTGAATGAGQPLPFGAFGVWHEVGPLGSAREGAGATFAADPTIAGRFYLYAIGGRDAAGTALASYDYAPITVAADGSQTVGAFTPGGSLLASGRWELAAVAMEHLRASVVPAGETWIYAMGGFNAAATSIVRDVTAAKVSSGGALTPAYEVDSMQPGQAGYGVAGANNFLFAFGGRQGGGGAATAFAGAAKLCAPAEAGCAGGPPPEIPEPPDLVNWNALGFSLQQARYLGGSALESAFIFLVGGQSDTMAATSTTERTHW